MKLHAVLSSMVKSHTVLLLPAQDVSHPSVQSIHTVYVVTCSILNNSLGYQLHCCNIAVLMLKQSSHSI